MHSARRAKATLSFFALAVCTVFLTPSISMPVLRVQEKPTVDSHVARKDTFAQQVATVRAKQSDPEAARRPFELAAGLLDEEVLGALNAVPESSTEQLNKKLGTWITRKPAVGESYRVVRFSSGSPWFLLIANLDANGPSAVRIYARPTPGEPYKLLGQIDAWSQKDYFDGYLECLLIHQADGVFLTVTGRTDEWKTGFFAAWKFDGKSLQPLWSSGLWTNSEFKEMPGGVLITHCGDESPDPSEGCTNLVRERFTWVGGVWKRTGNQ